MDPSEHRGRADSPARGPCKPGAGAGQAPGNTPSRSATYGRWLERPDELRSGRLPHSYPACSGPGSPLASRRRPAAEQTPMPTSGLFRVEPEAALNVIRPAAEQTPIMPSGPAFHFPQGRRAAPRRPPGASRGSRGQSDCSLIQRRMSQLLWCRVTRTLMPRTGRPSATAPCNKGTELSELRQQALKWGSDSAAQRPPSKWPRGSSYPRSSHPWISQSCSTGLDARQ